MDMTGRTTHDAFKYLHMNPDEREYHSTVLILKDMNIKTVDIISNNTEKLSALIKSGIGINKRVSIVSRNPEWKAYLESKRKQFGHLI